MIPIHDVNGIAHIIQLAVTPVFLLTGIAAFLGVLSTRLGRIIDRARILERQLHSITVCTDRYTLKRKELKILWKRVKIINQAIRLCTTAALIVCVVVVTLFVRDFSVIDLSFLIASLFILAMLTLIIGLVCFLREVSMATYTMRMGLEVHDMT